MKFIETINSVFINVDQIESIYTEFKKVRSGGYYSAKIFSKTDESYELLQLPSTWFVEGQQLQLGEEQLITYLKFACQKISSCDGSCLLYDELINYITPNFNNYLLSLIKKNTKEQKEPKEKKTEG